MDDNIESPKERFTFECGRFKCVARLLNGIYEGRVYGTNIIVEGPNLDSVISQINERLALLPSKIKGAEPKYVRSSYSGNYNSDFTEKCEPDPRWKEDGVDPYTPY